MKQIINTFFLLILLFSYSCKKLVEIDPPVNSITTSQVFADSTDAASAVAGMYASIAYSRGSFGNCIITLYPGQSADELLQFGSVNPLTTNTLLASNGYTPSYWTQGYALLYKPNAVIAGLQASITLSSAIKNEFLGEAYWFRAFINFYLVNLYGDIPLITTTNYKSSALASRASVSQVYSAIISDLQNAQNLLPADYSEGGGERIRANKWAATALLARVDLFLPQPQWADAETQATTVINNSGLYSLGSLNSIFLVDNPEAILQWQNNSSLNNLTFNATAEGLQIIPRNSHSQPNFYLTNQLLSAFESGDLRKTAWIDSTVYSGVTYYYPYKYKVGPAQEHPNAPVTEYYTVLRLAEQYLIRAEARAQQNKLPEAINDLNVIRNRAGLVNLSPALNQTEVFAAVAQERRIELFAEWGHRWLDLKRTNTAGTVFSTIPYKSQYQSFQQLYPVPPGELQFDPNLTQNPGY